MLTCRTNTARVWHVEQGERLNTSERKRDLVVRRDALGWTLAVALIAVGVATVVWGQAAKAQGTVTVGKTKVAIASAMAVGYKAPNGQLISVLLSDKPANAKEFLTDTRIGAGESYVAGIFEGAWKSRTPAGSSRGSRSRSVPKAPS